MNNMSMKEYCVSASEKCVCIRRSEANKILHVTEGENAQLVRLRTKDNVFIVWLYDGEEGTLFYPAFRVDEGKLPDITEILAADEVKPDTAFFCYRTGEYYYLLAEREEKDDDGYKYEDISDTEIMQIVVFANERLVWQIFNKSNYPEIPSSPIIKIYRFETNGEYKPFWFVQINCNNHSSDDKINELSQSIVDCWMNEDIGEKFWKLTTIDKFLQKDCSGKQMETLEKGVFIPVFWDDNAWVLKNQEAFIKKPRLFDELVKFGLYQEYLEEKDEEGHKFLRIISNPIYRSGSDYLTKEIFVDISENIVVSGKAFKHNDNYLAFFWNDTFGLYLTNSKKPRLYFMKNNADTSFFNVFNEYEFQSVEDLSFRHYLRWNDPRAKNKAIDAYAERNLSPDELYKLKHFDEIYEKEQKAKKAEEEAARMSAYNTAMMVKAMSSAKSGASDEKSEKRNTDE